jgi:uncharacterized protein YkwD
VRPFLSFLLVVGLSRGTVADEPPKLSADEQGLLEQVNGRRRQVQLPPLAVHPALLKMAREHSAAMAGANRLGHDVGKPFTQRLEAAGYASDGAGENVGHGFRTTREAVEGWLRSPGHRANIESREYREIGLGVSTAGDGSRYWTLVFGTPRPR